MFEKKLSAFMSPILSLAIIISISIPSNAYAKEIPSTIEKLRNLSLAIEIFKGDLTFIPFYGRALNSTSILRANEFFLGATKDKNILVNPEIYSPDQMGRVISREKFQKYWRGPYMESPPEEFMRDSWGTKIILEYYEKNLFLHSAGPDKKFLSLRRINKGKDRGDDLFLKIRN